MKAWLVCAVVLVASALSGQPAASSAAEESKDSRAGRVFAYYSTTSYTRLSTVTITGLSTCVSTTTTATACKRRKRRHVALDLFSEIGDELNLLESSANEEVEERADRVKRDLVDEPQAVDREGRILTIWTTAFQTLTLTTTSIISGTTVTASAFCTDSAGNPAHGCFK